MAPQRVKTAFQFFQGERLREVKKELGPGTSMGTAMTELSSRWKNMNDDAKAPYNEMEFSDRQRFAKESAEADAKAMDIQRKRRDKLVAQDNEDTSKRGARARVENERAHKETKKHKRKQKRMAEMDPEVMAERKRVKEAKKAEAVERQRIRDEREGAVADRHKKLDKTAAKKQNQRLEYLLKQSSIFAKLKMGGSSAEDNKSKDEPKGAGSAHRGASKPIEDDEEEEEEEEHVFLTKQPNCIKFGTLKPYQLEGLNWMIHLMEKGLNGILADEMGLGKTLQSISILAYCHEFLKNQGPHLICVPKSTLSNWMNELKRWCPSLRAIRFHGSKEERMELVEKCFTSEAAAHDGKRPTRQRKNEETGEMEDDNSDNPRPWDVCVTTYEVCNSEKKVLSKFAWKYLVIDEAHRLKNEASIFSKTVRAFNTAHRLLLTGTPLQNNLHELWALLNFLLPDIFSSSEQFDEWFDLEIDDEEAKKKMISQLHKILRPFMIRRLKSDVAKGLPPKTETLLMVGMSKIQKQLYKKLLLRDIDSITGNQTGKNKTAVLNIVMQLRKCCGHPYLFEGIEDRSLDPLGQHLVDNCGKLVMVDKLLKKLKERGSRVLIFTQMTRVLDILEDFMVMRGYQYCRIDGNTDYDVRESSIEAFNKENSEKFCFILSTRAGGLGINLQTADTCILYDSDWNPQADLQAQDRCHRLGQKKPVNIYRLVSENTVEEKIVERAQQKLKLDAMVVQQGRLKDKDKVSKDEIMNAVRFGADQVFRSEESTITDDDIEVILKRGEAKTKELAAKIQKAEKGDLLDFRLDAGMSAQTFDGIDYSDRQVRAQLRLLAADSLGKRERKPPPTNYNPIIAPKKTMMVNNLKIKLPKSLRLPRMEDHHFYNRERLLELAKLEFQTYAALRSMGQLPPREYIDKAKTLLPAELAQEKLDLLSEGFGHWSRSQYFHFVKAAAKYGREDIQSISADMDLPLELVSAYSDAFWKYASTELKTDEWERVKANVEKGEQKIAKRKKLSALLEKFVGTFENPREDMTFANKGTAHFSLEQDRALLCAVEKLEYGNWDAVREELLADPVLQFSHTVQGLNCDMIGKRCDYRIRQMEKELELREKKLRSEKPPNVIAAENAVLAIKEMEDWEKKAMDLELRGEKVPPFDNLSDEAKEIIEERLQEKQPWIDRIREIEVQVRGCMALADETRKAILRGDQYVNYSNITLKAGGPHTMSNDNSSVGVNVEKEVNVEASINAKILRVPECGECKYCLDEQLASKMCLKRLQLRSKLIKDAESMPMSGSVHGSELNGDNSHDGRKSKNGAKKKSFSGKSKEIDTLSNKTKELTNGSKTKADKSGKVAKKIRPSFGENNRGNPLGNKKMSVPEELMPELSRRIGPQGTNERMKIINEFVSDHPITSIRQVTLKFSEIVTKVLPACVPPPAKRGGRALSFFLRPRCYHYLPAERRPEGWEKYAEEDEIAWEKEMKAKAKEKAKKEKKIQDLKEESTKLHVPEVDSVKKSTGVDGSRIRNGDEIEEEHPRKKKKKKSKKSSK